MAGKKGNASSKPSNTKKGKKQLKIRTNRSKSIATIHEGIVASIQKQTGSNESPNPTAYFVALITLLSNPDKNMLPQLLVLLDQTLKQMADNTVKFIEYRDSKISNTLCNIVRKFSDHELAGKKALQCARTLYTIVDMNDLTLSNLQNFEPSKFNIELMPSYNELMQTVYTNLYIVNPALCRSKLPHAVERYVQQFLNDTPEDVATSAGTALKKLLNICINKEMLEDDTTFPNDGVYQSCLDKCLHSLTPLLTSPHFNNNWDIVAEVFGVVFHKMGRKAFPRLKGTILTLDEIRMMDDFHYRSATERALGRACNAVGVENFLSIIPFNVVDLDEKRLYVLRIIKKFCSHGSLAYWNSYFMPKAAQCRVEARQEAERGNEGFAKLFEIQSERIWNLVTSFCKYPTDLADDGNFLTLAKEMVETWKSDSSAIKSATCHALRLLVDKNLYLRDVTDADMLEDGDELASDDDDVASKTTRTSTVKTVKTTGTFASVFGEMRARDDDMEDYEKELEAEDPHGYHGISQEQAKKNVAILTKYSRVLLPKLCNLFESAPSDGRRYILEAIHSYAKISAPEVLNQCFTTISRKLLESPDEIEDEAAANKIKATRHVMTDIAVGVLDSMDTKQLSILYQLCLPIANEKKDMTLQKKAYKLLCKLCDICKDQMMDALQNSFAAIAEAQLNCGIGSRHYRLQLLVRLFNMLYEFQPEMLPSVVQTFLPEVIMSVKEQGKRLQDTAFYLVYLFGVKMKDLHKGDVDPYMGLVMEGLKGTSVDLVQTTIMVLARLLTEYHMNMSAACTNDLITEVCARVGQNDTSIRNAAMGFTKLALKVMCYHTPTKEALEANLKTLMEGISFWLHDPRAKGIRMKMRVLVERIVKRFGLDKVVAVTPVAKRRYVQYVEKERQKVQRQKQREADREKLTTAEWAEKYKKEFGGMVSKNKRTRVEKTKHERESRVVMGSTSADPENLLDPSIVKSFFLRPKAQQSDKKTVVEEDDDGFEMSLDPTGKILITDKNSVEQLPGTMLNQARAMEHAMEKTPGDFKRAMKKRSRNEEDDDDDDDKPDKKVTKPEQGAANSGFQGVRRILKARREENKQRLVNSIQTGAQFKSKRAGGDLKKTGGIDPYAFVPLSAGFLNKRNKRESAKRFDSVVSTKDESKYHKQTLSRSKRNAQKKHK